MAKFLRYAGGFLSRAGVVWRVEILQDADAPFTRVGRLDFEADEALVIECGQAGKDEVICGSTATLRIISPGDRTYEDLYTIAPGRIRMDVYREDSLYWSGTLDSEFYEEPYEKASDYTVALTFSDLGILDRLKYDLSGMQTLYGIVSHCISRAALDVEIDESMISTRLSDEDTSLSLSDLKVNSDNFYDEDGEALTLSEVLEGILQPLALRIVQRAGRIWIHDLNALYECAPVREVVWDGDSQTLGTDRVYKRVKITWSPYVQNSDLNKRDCWEININPAINALNELDGIGVNADGSINHGASLGFESAGHVYSYLYGSNPNSFDYKFDHSAIGFSIWVSQKGANASLGDDGRARFFKIVKHNEGDDSEGVAVTWPSIWVELKSGLLNDYRVKIHGLGNDLKGTTDTCGTLLFKTTPARITPVSDGVMLSVQMDMLLDARFNIFSEPEDFYVGKINVFLIKTDEAEWKKKGNFVYVPVRILFKSDDGSLYCWDNRGILGDGPDAGTIDFTEGFWVPYTGREWGYLAYYDPENRAENSGVIGWKSNRPAINPHKGYLSPTIKNTQGQYLPCPPGSNVRGGEITVEVCSGWIVRKANGDNVTDRLLNVSKYRWALCKIPSIGLASRSPYGGDIENSDVEYCAVINPDAMDDMDIDTICGSKAGGVPSARGVYLSATDGRQIMSLTRAGRTSQLEDLLAGTLFSQFGQRRTKLSGEMRIADDGLTVYTEANQEGKKFMMTSDVQNVIMDVSDATIVELRPDEYEKRGNDNLVNIC